MRSFQLPAILMLVISLAFATSCKPEEKQPEQSKAVSGVYLSMTELSLEAGQTFTLTATVQPSNAENKNVSWASDNSSVVSVDQSGIVTAVKPGSATVTVTTAEGGKTATTKITVTKAPTGIKLEKSTLKITMGGKETLKATISPSDATEKNIQWSSDNTSAATVDSKGEITALKPGKAIITAMTTVGSFKAECEVTIIPVTPELVDLGLSVKWAAFNLGATKPEEFGSYYAWGETDPKPFYSWGTYKWCKDKEGKEFSKYISSGVTSYTNLEKADDAAYVALGGKWRMPTYYEVDELVKNCTWTKTSVNGVAGYEGKSKKNGKTIFLPYTGMRVEDKTASLDGGYYWSSSLAQAGSTSQALYIQMFDSRTPIPSGNNRCWGYAIRPVNK